MMHGITLKREMMSILSSRIKTKSESHWSSPITDTMVFDMNSPSLDHRLLTRYENDLHSASPESFIQELLPSIPNTWVICSLSIDVNRGVLYVTRYEQNFEPLVLRLPLARHEQSISYEEVFEKLKKILKESNETTANPGLYTGKAGKVEWWRKRKELNMQLKELLDDVDSKWLGGFRVF